MTSFFPTVTLWFRICLYSATMICIGQFGFVTGLYMTLVGRAYDNTRVMCVAFHAIISRVLDIKLEVEGKEHLDAGPAIFMINHQSALDFLVMGPLVPKRTTSIGKWSLQFTPIGPALKISGTIFIRRSHLAAATLIEAAKKVKKDRISLWVYPEGTRHNSPRPEMLPLKKGGFHLAIQSGLPIIPIVTENYWHIRRPGYFGPGTIKVRVLPPVQTEGLTAADLDDLKNQIQEQMLLHLRDISGHTHKQERIAEEE